MADPGRRDVVLTGVITAIGRFANAIGAFIVFPLVLRRYGALETSVWATVVSLTSIVGFADMGIGAALMNRIARLHVANDRRGVAQLLTTSTAVSAFICIGLIVVFIVSLLFLNWSRVLGLSGNGSDDLFIVGALVVPTLIAIPFSLVARVQLAMESGRFDAMWQLAAAVLTIVALLFVTKLSMGVWAAILTSTGIPATIKIIQSFSYVRGDSVFRSLMPADLSVWAREFFYPAGMFFLLQGCSAVAFSIDLYIANKNLGAHDTVQYAALLRIFSIPQVLVGVFTGALWPQFTRLYAKKDCAGMRRLLSTALIGAVALALLFGVILLVLRKELFSFWLGAEYTPSFILVSALSISVALVLAGVVTASALNAMEVLKYQLTAAVVLASVGFLLKSYLCKYYGAVGISVGSLLVYIPVCLIPSVIILSKRLSRMRISINDEKTT